MTKNFGFCAAIGLAALAMNGCTTFSKAECENMNWQLKGGVAAARGEMMAQSQEFYIKNCQAEHGVVVDQAAFQGGFAKGLEVFCTPQSLREFGRRGGQYLGTCPRPAEAKLIDPYREGRVAYLEDEVVNLNNRISGLESEVSSLQSENISLRSQPVSCPNHALKRSAQRRDLAGISGRSSL